MRDLDEAAAAGSQRARLALDVYVRAIRRYLGAFLLELDGVDVISFSGGIGENSWETRAAVCRNLAAFEIEMDDAVNRAARTAQVISSRTSAVKVLIIPADEESIVARDTVSVVEKAVLERVGAGQTR
jgi:acetate kinase